MHSHPQIQGPIDNTPLVELNEEMGVLQVKQGCMENWEFILLPAALWCIIYLKYSLTSYSLSLRINSFLFILRIIHCTFISYSQSLPRSFISFSEESLLSFIIFRSLHSFISFHIHCEQSLIHFACTQSLCVSILTTHQLFQFQPVHNWQKIEEVIDMVEVLLFRAR
jgi:hypothetical protein